MRVLIIKLSSMGDVIHTLPALSDARRCMPDITFDWVVEDAFAEIPRWHSAVGEIIPVAWRRWRSSWWQRSCRKEMAASLKKLRARKYDLIIDAQGLYKSALIARLPQGSRAGYSWHATREPLASMLYTHKFDISRRLHAITRIRQLFAAALGYKVDVDDARTFDYDIKNNIAVYAKNHHAEDNSANIFPTASDGNDSKSLMFLHGSSHARKCWPETKWQELMILAKMHNYRVLLPWGNADERVRAQRLAQGKVNTVVLPQLTLTEMALTIQHCAGVVAVDSGLGHLAAALDVPTLSLYGPTDPALIGTRGAHVAHLDIAHISATVVWMKLQELTDHSQIVQRP
jgi:heptosyltransferase I